MHNVAIVSDMHTADFFRLTDFAVYPVSAPPVSDSHGRLRLPESLSRLNREKFDIIFVTDSLGEETRAALADLTKQRGTVITIIPSIGSEGHTGREQLLKMIGNVINRV